MSICAFYRPLCLSLALGVWVAFLAWTPFVMSAEARRRAPQQSAFKTEGGSRPGDWSRYDRIDESQSLGTTKRMSILMTALENDGKEIAVSAALTDSDTGETNRGEFSRSIGGTVEDTLFSDVRLSGNERIKKGVLGRETVVAAGRAFDCVVLSATASGRGVVTESRIWYSPEAPFLGMVKKETVSKAMRGRKVWMSITYRTELKEWGDVSHPPVQ